MVYLIVFWNRSRSVYESTIASVAALHVFSSSRSTAYLIKRWAFCCLIVMNVSFTPSCLLIVFPLEVSEAELQMVKIMMSSWLFDFAYRGGVWGRQGGFPVRHGLEIDVTADSTLNHIVFPRINKSENVQIDGERHTVLSFWNAALGNFFFFFTSFSQSYLNIFRMLSNVKLNGTFLENP